LAGATPVGSGVYVNSLYRSGRESFCFPGNNFLDDSRVPSSKKVQSELLLRRHQAYRDLCNLPDGTVPVIAGRNFSFRHSACRIHRAVCYSAQRSALSVGWVVGSFLSEPC
jgi:hypothetical protein